MYLHKEKIGMYITNWVKTIYSKINYGIKWTIFDFDLTEQTYCTHIFN